MTVSQSLIDIAAHALPLSQRREYVATESARLADLSEAVRVPRAAAVLATAPLARWEALPPTLDAGERLLCFVGHHDDKVTHPNPENGAIVAWTCTRCGRVHDPRQYQARVDNSDIAYGTVFLSGGR